MSPQIGEELAVGELPRSRCDQCNATAVLPIPAGPLTTATLGTPIPP